MNDDLEPKAPAPPPEHCFEVTPYRPDGGFSSAGLALCLAVTLAAATGLGYGIHRLDGWAPEVEWLWVIIAGALLAGLGCLAVSLGKVRNGAVVAVVGLLGGVQLLGAARYFGYEAALERLEGDALQHLPGLAKLEVVRPIIVQAHKEGQPVQQVPVLPQAQAMIQRTFPPQVTDAVQAVVRTHLKDRPADLLLILKGPLPVKVSEKAQAAIHEAVAGFGFFDYLDWKATQGARLTLPKVRRPITLGYAATFIYWSIEALVAGLAAAVVMVLYSRSPYCTACDRWKESRELGRLNLPRERAVEVFTRGSVVELAGEDLLRDDGPLRLTVLVCPTCATEAPIEVKLAEVTKNDKDKEEVTEFAQLTYPGPALRVLEALFVAPAKPAAAEEVKSDEN